MYQTSLINHYKRKFNYKPASNTYTQFLENLCYSYKQSKARSHTHTLTDNDKVRTEHNLAQKHIHIHTHNTKQMDHAILHKYQVQIHVWVCVKIQEQCRVKLHLKNCLVNGNISNIEFRFIISAVTTCSFHQFLARTENERKKRQKQREREGELGNGGKLVNKVDAGFQVLNCKGV